MTEAPFVIFITGGAGAGKSMFAERLALEINSARESTQKIAYLATGPKSDAEFCAKIAEHQKRRSSLFATFEEEIDIDHVFAEVQESHDIVLLECLTTWVGNLMHRLDKEVVRTVAAQKLGTIVGEKQNLTKQNVGVSTFFITRSVNNTDSILCKAKNTAKVFIFVTNEVGLGVVPQTASGRAFRDVLGTTNRNMLRVSDAAFFLISGMAVPLK